MHFADGKFTTIHGIEQLTQGAPTIIFNNENLAEDDQQLISRLIEQHNVKNDQLSAEQVKIIQPGQSLLGTGEKHYVLAQPEAAHDASKQEQLVVDQSIIEQIQNQLDPSQNQLTTEDGQPVQVAYQIIHDDENQQIVEIQYQPVGVEDGDEPIVESQLVLEQTPITNAYVEPVKEQETFQTDLTQAAQPSSTATETSVATEESVAAPVMELHEQTLSVDDSNQNVTKRDTSFLSADQTIEFVTNPDFNSQDYYNWLSNFTELCKQVKVPLDMELFQRISQVHKTLSDILATPKGVLLYKDNFKILMSISKDLNDIISQHLTHSVK